MARRLTLLRRIRETHPNVLLLDSGDIFQGTPYFNFFGGEVEFRAMSAMTEHHDIHHASMKGGYYASITPVFDILFGTAKGSGR